MKRMYGFSAALLLLFPFPWFGKTKSGLVHVGADGRALVIFSKPFSRHPDCVAFSRLTGEKKRPFAWSREGVEFQGIPSDVLKWTCQHNPKGVK